MEDGMPELRLVRPLKKGDNWRSVPTLKNLAPKYLKYLKLGPEMSSSHWRQSLSEPSGLLLGAPVIQAMMQGCVIRPIG